MNDAYSPVCGWVVEECEHVTVPVFSDPSVLCFIGSDGRDHVSGNPAARKASVTSGPTWKLSGPMPGPITARMSFG